MLMIGVWLLGCRGANAPAYWHACQCTYTTDFDQPGRHDVQVCAATEDAPMVAQSCLRNEGVGAVEACRCGPPKRADRCSEATACRPGLPP